MKHYQDITLLPDAEISLSFLWQKVYQQIHLALVENKIGENHSAIALSLPKYKAPSKEQNKEKGFPLGNKVRIFAEQLTQLEQVNISQWLLRLQDYVHVTSIKAVPDNVKEHVAFKRKHVKGKNRRLTDIMKKAEHQSSKFNVPIEQCINTLTAKYAAEKEKQPLPFIVVKSLSSKNDTEMNKQFPLFIEMQTALAPTTGEFNCYGFSSLKVDKLATVPWF